MRACNRKLGDQVRMGNYYSSMRIDSFLVSVRVDGLGEKLVFLLRFVCAQIVRLSIYEFFSAKFSIVHSALWVKWACVRPSAWNYRVIHGAMSIWYGSFLKKLVGSLPMFFSCQPFGCKWTFCFEVSPSVPSFNADSLTVHIPFSDLLDVILKNQAHIPHEWDWLI